MHAEDAPNGIVATEERRLVVTEEDLRLLQDLIVDVKRREPRGNAYLDSLEHELSSAEILQPTTVPSDVVTMNSTVHLKDIDTEEEMVLTLVTPEEADIEQSKISVLAPIGTAVLGYRRGDQISWPVPDGVRRLLVVDILYQPEAHGAGMPGSPDER
jgi:regulator of nucleoside diphosphate kinase